MQGSCQNCIFYYFFRYSRGLIPVSLWNATLKCEMFWNPTSKATSPIDFSGICKSLFASPIRTIRFTSFTWAKSGTQSIWICLYAKARFLAQCHWVVLRQDDQEYAAPHSDEFKRGTPRSHSSLLGGNQSEPCPFSMAIQNGIRDC